MIDTTTRIPNLLPWIELTAFWSELCPDSQDALLDSAVLLEFEPGDRIEIDFGLLISGTAGIEYVMGNGRRAIAELFHSGDLVDVQRGERRPQGRLVALSIGSVLALDSAAFDLCARHHSDIVSAYRHQIEDQTGRLRDHVNDLAVKTPLERIVSVLFELRRWPEANLGEAADIVLPMLRKDIAAYAGMKPETVSRALRRLLDAGLIRAAKSDKEAITLLDRPRLRRLANGGAPRGGENLV